VTVDIDHLYIKRIYYCRSILPNLPTYLFVSRSFFAADGRGANARREWRRWATAGRRAVSCGGGGGSRQATREGAAARAPVHGGGGGPGVRAGSCVADWQSSRARPRASRHGLRSRSPACHAMAALPSIARLKAAPAMAACHRRRPTSAGSCAWRAGSGTFP
jgi:hypothetical protein